MKIVFREANDARHLPQEPTIDARAFMDELDLGSAPQGGEQPPEPIVGRLTREELVNELGWLGDVDPGWRLPEQTLPFHLERAKGLLQGRLERAVDRHDLAGGLHLRAERAVGCRELIERPSRDLHDDVIERGLECGGRLLRHCVRDLVKALADRDLGRNTCDRIAGRLRRERRAPRDARVHLDDEIWNLRLGVSGGRAIRVERELHVAPALDPQSADDPQGCGAEHLVLLVGQRLRGRYNDGVAGVHAHRVDVLHVADGDACIGAVTHHLVLDLFPTEEGSLDEHLADRRSRDSARHARSELRGVVRHSTTRAAECEGRPDDERIGDARGERERVLDRMCRDRIGHGLADRQQKLLECLAVLGLLDRRKRRTQEPDSEPLEHPRLRQLHREVQAGLSAECREESGRALFLDDPLEHIDGERLEVRDVRDAWVGHDRRGIRVHEDGLDAFFA